MCRFFNNHPACPYFPNLLFSSTVIPCFVSCFHLILWFYTIFSGSLVSLFLQHGQDLIMTLECASIPLNKIRVFLIVVLISQIKDPKSAGNSQATHRPVAPPLTIMKCIGRLVMAHICTGLPINLDSQWFPVQEQSPRPTMSTSNTITI